MAVSAPPRRAFAVLAGLALIAAGVTWGLRDWLTPEALATHHAGLTGWREAQGARAVAAFFAATVVAALVSLPGIGVFTLAAGLLFGPVWGTLLVTAAATLGATGLFLATRAGLGRWRPQANGPRAEAWAEELRRNEIAALLLLRIAPVVPFFVANTLPAVLGVRLGRYTATTFAGLIPGTAVLALLGGGLGDAMAAGGTPGLQTLLWVGFGVPALLLAAAMMARRLRRG